MTHITANAPAQDLPETRNVTSDTPPLKTYSVLYAEDIPHYGGVDIEARDDAEALGLARSFDTDHVSYYKKSTPQIQ